MHCRRHPCLHSNAIIGREQAACDRGAPAFGQTGIARAVQPSRQEPCVMGKLKFVARCRPG
ncbi:MAG TPA: hypothetical protein DCF61_14740 [Alphaproteobacteria bacterium]|nr:hypothetical protein [Alphaproteobacteria bacterium]